MKTTSPSIPRKRGPKIEPFSKHDQARIIKELAEHGEWKGTRAGVRVHFANFRDLWGAHQIQYEYRPQPRAKLEVNRADTLAHAIETLNRILLHNRNLCQTKR
jgi:hypothetical protein